MGYPGTTTKFEVQLSTFGPAANIGLYVRAHNYLVCEYRGEPDYNRSMILLVVLLRIP